jgi:hypothetical protein
MSLIDGVRGQVEVVRSVLGEEWSEVPVRGVLCFIGCTWTYETVKHLNGVDLVWPLALPKQVAAPGSLSPHEVAAIASHLRKSLQQAK